MPILNQIKNEFWLWNESKKELHILDSYLDMRSAEKPQNIEGFGYSLVVLNESGIILKNRYLWDNCIRPMTLDFHARCYFIGTPKGKLDKTGQEHLYYTFYKRGLDPVEHPDWKSYVAPSYMNPFLSKADIEDLEREVPSIIAAQEIRAEFIDISEDSIFKNEWWEYVDELPPEAGILSRLISVDTAFKTGDENDYNAFTVWARTQEAFYILHAEQERLDFPQLIAKTEELFNTWKVDAVLIEDRASGQSLLQMFQRSTLPTIPFRSDSDKISRATAISPLIESHKVKLIRGSWNKMLVDQLSIFPMGEYDDLTDSVSQALNYMKNSMPLNSSRVPVSRKIVRITPDHMRGY
jgi:predicted phage terminase large subunit-like protein